MPGKNNRHPVFEMEDFFLGKSVNKARKAASCGKQVFYGAGPRSEKNWKNGWKKGFLWG